MDPRSRGTRCDASVQSFDGRGARRLHVYEAAALGMSCRCAPGWEHSAAGKFEPMPGRGEDWLRRHSLGSVTGSHIGLLVTFSVGRCGPCHRRRIRHGLVLHCLRNVQRSNLLRPSVSLGFPHAPNFQLHSQELETTLVRALLAGDLPPAWWSKRTMPLKRQALRVALRVAAWSDRADGWNC